MAAPVLKDKMLAARVRNLVLTQIESALNGKDKAFKKQLLLKLSINALPRLNEVTGEGGEPIKFNLINYGNLGGFGGAVSLQTTSIPTGTATGTAEVQNSGDAPASGEVENGTQSAN